MKNIFKLSKRFLFIVFITSSQTRALAARVDYVKLLSN